MFFLTAAVNLNMFGMDMKEIFLRLACAMAVGLVIGIEREHTHRPAGMRTHVLVALGSCVVMIIGEMIFAEYRTLGGMPDPARLGAQVISGVSFLGAGTIMREGVNVKGLTTAASLWTVACLGLAAGAGYYTVAVAGMLMVFITLTIFEVLQRKLFLSHNPKTKFVIETSQVAPAMKAIAAHAKSCRMKVYNTQVEEIGEELHRITVHVAMSSLHNEKRMFRFCEKLAAEPGVKSVIQYDKNAPKKTAEEKQKA